MAITMASETEPTGEHIAAFQANIAKMEKLSERMTTAIANKKSADPGLAGPGNELFSKAFEAYFSDAMSNPAKIFAQQAEYWTKSMAQVVETGKSLTGDDTAVTETKADRRFSHPMWQDNPFFNMVKQQYLLSSQAVEDSVADLEGLSAREKNRLTFFSKQIVDMMAPTNFLATNPAAIEKAMETEGQSLVDGMENMVRDLENNNGELLVTLADQGAFEVGENLANSPGGVVFRNKMLELIQYEAKTEQVHKTPIVIFPPWINKYYILDLKPANSFVKWLTEQGYTVFMVSWVNPDASYADTGMVDYVHNGYLKAIEAVKSITNEPQVNAIGYCIGGTTLSLTAALLSQRGDDSIKSVTLFTTITDFSDQGEMAVFLDDDFVDGIERQVVETGVLESVFMTRTFSYLRPNDLIYGPAIKSYMMGEAPPVFDLLYWNSDSTNLPGRMAVKYLRQLCQKNEFALDGFPLGDDSVTLADVKQPIFAIGCETDHIAAWDASLNGVRQMGSKDKTFVMSQSGHIAGIVNPPSKNKYGHYTNTNLTDPETWRENAELTAGSWWPVWEKWLSGRSEDMIPARKVGTKTFPVLCEAPGTYVLSKSKN
ncbi:poly(3-hydroxyalkanoate) polymerase [Rhodobacterales bacterium HTCC2150]|nr:poly(3-hydroxyalkanoate) polymerase [Rhodobacterales bacterium HTCC2150] [Rhodobacteraceae bacterium HTCC2150]